MVTAFSADSAGYSPLKTLDDRVVDILPKDQSRHVPAMIDLGVYMYTPEVFDRIPRLLPSARGETEIWDLNLSYAAEGELRFSQIDGWWSDTGSDLKTYCEADTHYANR
ncbi:hypothetical protein GCM10023214_53800 [Amycolatopsis dongchuanensis]|uniref:Nucleotidyl transferase n=3 Tax=Pseudonocardiaceae TaxID=2070 RepID=A0A1I3PBW8_9PSEU|nr:Nucleotidyl transferase [Amycolatopsis sacchari]